MKKLKGTSVNYTKNVIGRITHSPIRLHRSKFILITSEPNSKVKGYSAVLTGSDYKISACENIGKTPLYYNINGIEELADGDVVMLERDGTINVLYQKGASQNALLLTERCNCSCVMCPQPKVYEESNKTDANIKLISLIDRSTESLALTGGEPTLIGEDLFKIIRACKKHLPKTDLVLLTNGINFSDFEYVKTLATIDHPNLTIAISLYSDTDLEHNKVIRTRGFYKTIEGLYNLALFKQKIEIRIVIHALTFKRLPRLAEFIYHNFPFTFHVALMGMETIGLARTNIDELWVDPYRYRELLEKAVTYLDRRLMKVSIYNVQLCLLPMSLWQFARKSISSWKNVYLDKCSECNLRDQCCGFFASSVERQSDFIKPLSKELRP